MPRDTLTHSSVFTSSMLSHTFRVNTQDMKDLLSVRALCVLKGALKTLSTEGCIVWSLRLADTGVHPGEDSNIFPTSSAGQREREKDK